MNKQELIEKYKKYEDGLFDIGAKVACQNFLKDLEQLDELEKATIPQFVADWYEKKKHDLNHYIWDYIYNWNHQEESEFKRWMNCSITSFQTLINMHQFGYEVEKEKKYKVVLLNYNDGHLNLVNVRTLGNNIIFFTKRTQFEPRSFELTKNEIISSGFGWVFDCPGIEIEEVE